MACALHAKSALWCINAPLKQFLTCDSSIPCDRGSKLSCASPSIVSLLSPTLQAAKQHECCRATRASDTGGRLDCALLCHHCSAIGSSRERCGKVKTVLPQRRLSGQSASGPDDSSWQGHEDWHRLSHRRRCQRPGLFQRCPKTRWCGSGGSRNQSVHVFASSCCLGLWCLFDLHRASLLGPWRFATPCASMHGSGACQL